MINRVLHLVTPIETKAAPDDDELLITGYASTDDKDRMGDVILADAWKQAGALDNYLKNPVVLAYHDMSKPIGKTIDHTVDKKGLKITAKISKAAGDIAQLIKDGIVSTFSVGFMVKDADYDSTTDIFVIKAVELLEVSVVTIPANASATFSVAKNFNSSEEYEEFKKQFNKSQDISEENLMKDEKDTNNAPTVDFAALAKQIREEVVRDLEAQKAAETEAKRKAKEEAERVSAVATTAAERLIKDLENKLLEKEEEMSTALKGLHDTIREQAEDMQAVYSSKSKMNFTDNTSPFARISNDQRDGLVIASKIFGKPINELKSFENIVTKSGMQHWNGADAEWEEEYSTRVQNDLRAQLVVEPLFTTIPMATPTMHMPINPEAGFASWIHENQYRSDTPPWTRVGDATDTSTGPAQTHQLVQQTMIARKLATREYIGYEEEEDSIVALGPIIREAVARRMAKASDKAILAGTGVTTNTASYDPIAGLQTLTGVSPVTVSNGSGTNPFVNLDENEFVDMRKALGLWGLDPSELVLLVAHDTYYEMMKFTNFKTVDALGDRATILTGQVGSLFGMRVLVSQTFDNSAVAAGTAGTILATLVNPRNFVLGNLRGIMSESDRDIVNQQRVLVSSRRFAFNDIINGVGAVNLEFIT